MPAARTLIIFLRVPELGQVKTRLAATIGTAAALEAYKTMATAVLHAARATGARVVLRATPDDRLPDLAAWLGDDLTIEGQGSGDLGARMARAMAAHLPLGPVVLIGSDCPDADAAVLTEAFDRLATHDLVFGPATDGGYYLVGAARPVPAVFDGVPWSRDDTLAVSLRHAAAAGYRVALLSPLTDIDTEADWDAWRARRA